MHILTQTQFRIFATFISFISMFSFISVSVSASASVNVSIAASATASSSTTAAVFADTMPNADAIFRPGEISTVHIEIDQTDFKQMLDNPLDEEYKEATVTYNDITIAYTGVRVKGNSSLTSVARSDSDRYSFKLEFNKYIDQHLAGYTKINLNNNFSDPSYMREYITYQVMKEMGLATPNFSYVRVYINDQYYGLYLAVENIEETYLERNFGNATGNLYKADTGASLTWSEGLNIEQTGLTMKSGRSNNTKLLELIKALHQQQEVESYFDVDPYLRYLAVSTVMANMDSYQGMMSHNYYLYEQNGKFTFLPWDHNMSIGGMMGQNVTEQMEMLIDEPTVGAVSNYPLVHYVLSNSEYKALYHQYVQQTVHLLQPIQTQVDQLTSLIADAVKQDPTAFYTYDQFIANTKDETVDGKPGIVSFIEGRIAHVQQQLDGETASYVNGEGISGGGMRGMGEMGNRANGNMPEGAMPGFGNGNRPEGAMPNFGDGNLPDGVMPNLGDGNMPDGAVPNFGDGNMPDGAVPNFGDGNMNGMGRGGMGWGMNRNQSSNTTNQWNELLSVAILLTLLICSLVFIHHFKRYRGYKKINK